MNEICELFMNEEDLKALKLLYKLTNDKLVKILIEWKNNFEELEDTYTNEFSMYEDIMNYIWEKYEIDKEV